eukprot:COSAG03_NODE_5247_length_1298_cov_1.863219_1_plen_119_part_00
MPVITPRPTGHNARYRRNNAADIRGYTEREIREQWQTLMDEYEDSREPSKDAQYYTDDGTPIVLVDDTVNPRTLRHKQLSSITTKFAHCGRAAHCRSVRHAVGVLASGSRLLDGFADR